MSHLGGEEGVSRTFTKDTDDANHADEASSGHASFGTSDIEDSFDPRVPGATVGQLPSPSWPRSRFISFFPPLLQDWNPEVRPQGVSGVCGSGCPSSCSRSYPPCTETVLPNGSRPGTRSNDRPTARSGGRGPSCMSERPCTRTSTRPSSSSDWCRSGISSPYVPSSSFVGGATQRDIEDGLVRVFVRLPRGGCIVVRVDPHTHVGPMTRLPNLQEVWADNSIAQTSGGLGPLPLASSFFAGPPLGEVDESHLRHLHGEPPSLKELVESATGIPAASQKLVMHHFGPLDDDDRELHDFGFVDGTHITLSIKAGHSPGGTRGHRFLAGPGLAQERALGRPGALGMSAATRNSGSRSYAESKGSNGMQSVLPRDTCGAGAATSRFLDDAKADVRCDDGGSWRSSSIRTTALASHATRGRLKRRVTTKDAPDISQWENLSNFLTRMDAAPRCPVLGGRRGSASPVSIASSPRRSSWAAAGGSQAQEPPGNLAFSGRLPVTATDRQNSSRRVSC